MQNKKVLNYLILYFFAKYHITLKYFLYTMFYQHRLCQTSILSGKSQRLTRNCRP